MSAPESIEDSAPESSRPPVPAATLDAYGRTCGSLEPLIAQHLRTLTPGEVLEVRSDMEEAADGIGAWVWLAGHTLVAVQQDEPAPRARYYIRKKTPRT
jgi:TusA-related sulfurtransferase